MIPVITKLVADQIDRIGPVGAGWLMIGLFACILCLAGVAVSMFTDDSWDRRWQDDGEDRDR